MSDQNLDILPPSEGAERSLDIAATVASIVPWLGGPISQVLGGMSIDRKLKRVYDVLTQLADQVKDLDPGTSKQYVETEDFQDLLEESLRRVVLERSEAKRRAYSCFLAQDISQPSRQEYDEKLRMLRTLEELQDDHLRIIKAIKREPVVGAEYGYVGSIIDTLRRRLPDMSEDRIQDLTGQLVDLKVLNALSLNTMMTSAGAEDLRGRMTTYGERFFKFIGA